MASGAGMVPPKEWLGGRDIKYTAKRRGYGVNWQGRFVVPPIRSHASQVGAKHPELVSGRGHNKSPDASPLPMFGRILFHWVDFVFGELYRSLTNRTDALPYRNPKGLIVISWMDNIPDKDP
jgi:hypothetical protein